ARGEICVSFVLWAVLLWPVLPRCSLSYQDRSVESVHLWDHLPLPGCLWKLQFSRLLESPVPYIQSLTYLLILKFLINRYNTVLLPPDSVDGHPDRSSDLWMSI